MQLLDSLEAAEEPAIAIQRCDRTFAVAEYFVGRDLKDTGELDDLLDGEADGGRGPELPGPGTRSPTERPES